MKGDMWFPLKKVVLSKRAKKISKNEIGYFKFISQALNRHVIKKNHIKVSFICIACDFLKEYPSCKILECWLWLVNTTWRPESHPPSWYGHIIPDTYKWRTWVKKKQTPIYETKMKQTVLSTAQMNITLHPKPHRQQVRLHLPRWLALIGQGMHVRLNPELVWTCNFIHIHKHTHTYTKKFDLVKISDC